MQFMQPIISLDQITGGTLQAGLVPWVRIFDLMNNNQAGALVVNAAWTTICTISVGTLAVNDRVLIYARWKFTKGGVAGVSAAQIIQTGGTGVLTIDQAGNTPQSVNPNHDAAINWGGTFCGMYRCTTLGTATMELQCLSGGSNGALAAGDAAMEFYRLPQS